MTLIDIFSFPYKFFFFHKSGNCLLKKRIYLKKAWVSKVFLTKKIKEQKFSIKKYKEKNICRSKLQTLWEDVGKLL